VHPAIPEAHVDGSLHEAWRTAKAAGACRRGESTVLKVLEQRAAQQEPKTAA
jgi:hypothetical protein